MDIADQIYKSHEFPPVKGSNLEKLILNQLKKDFGVEHLTAYQKYREIDKKNKKTKDKKAKYNLIALNDGSPYGEWLATISNLKNPYLGTHLMPVEQISALKRIRNSKALPGWHVFITESKTSGVRITIYNDESVVITRIITSQFDDPASSAKYIRTELDSTVEYVRRLGLGESGKITLTTLTAPDLAQSLKSQDEASYVSSSQFLNSATIDKELKLNVARSSKDDSADRILAHLLSSEKPVLPIKSEAAREAENLKKYGLVFFIAALLIFAYMGYLIYTNMSGVKDNKDKNSRILKEKRANTTKYGRLREDLKTYPENYQQSVIDFNEIYNTYSRDSELPLKLIGSFAQNIDRNKFLTSLNIRNKRKENEPPYIARFDVNFSNIDLSNVALALDQISDFIEKTRDIMPNYVISAEDYKDNILSKNILNNEEKQEDVKILINVKGPVAIDEILGKD